MERKASTIMYSQLAKVLELRHRQEC